MQLLVASVADACMTARHTYIDTYSWSSEQRNTATRFLMPDLQVRRGVKFGVIEESLSKLCCPLYTTCYDDCVLRQPDCIFETI